MRHAPDCERGAWLVRQPKAGLLWTVVFGDGPPCTCRPAAGTPAAPAPADAR